MKIKKRFKQLIEDLHSTVVGLRPIVDFSKEKGESQLDEFSSVEELAENSGIPPGVIYEISNLKRGRISYAGLILGSYDGHRINTSDVAVFYDPILMAYLIVNVFTPASIVDTARMGSNRLLYLLGRNKVLLHEVNHAKHHRILERIGLNFEYMKDEGAEEIVTRLERASDSKSWFDRFMLFDYLIWTPWTAVRNLLIDTYHKIERVPYGKEALIVNALADPFAVILYRWSQNFQPPKINVFGIEINPDVIFSTIYLYWVGTVASALGSASERERRGLKKIESANDYKFPYTYNPVAALIKAFKIGKMVKTYKTITSPYVPIEDSKTLSKKLTHKFKIYPNKDKAEIRAFLKNEIDSLTEDMREILSYPRESGIPLSYSKLRYL